MLSKRAATAVHELYRRDGENSACDVAYTVLLACALTDDFLTNSLLEGIGRQQPFAHPLADELYNRAVRFGVPESWNDRIDWVQLLGSASIKSDSSVQNFLLLTKVRNGLAHSGAGLTYRDRRGKAFPTMVRQLGTVLDCTLVGHNFSFGSGTRPATLDISAEFIRTVDRCVTA